MFQSEYVRQMQWASTLLKKVGTDIDYIKVRLTQKAQEQLAKGFMPDEPAAEAVVGKALRSDFCIEKNETVPVQVYNTLSVPANILEAAEKLFNVSL